MIELNKEARVEGFVKIRLEKQKHVSISRKKFIQYLQENLESMIEKNSNEKRKKIEEDIQGLMISSISVILIELCKEKQKKVVRLFFEQNSIGRALPEIRIVENNRIYKLIEDKLIEIKNNPKMKY